MPKSKVRTKKTKSTLNNPSRLLSSDIAILLAKLVHGVVDWAVEASQQ
jgi:hypothetical protein